jgi:hypothetical protein
MILFYKLLFLKEKDSTLHLALRLQAGVDDESINCINNNKL